MKFFPLIVMVRYCIQIKKNLKFSMTFIKEATVNNEDDTPPDLPELDCQLDEIVL